MSSRAAEEVVREEETEIAMLRGVAKEISATIGPGLGFALFLQIDRSMRYASNAQRPDVVASIEEWLLRVDHRVPKREEVSECVDARLALERHCVAIGKGLRPERPTLFFLFEFKEGPGGHLAYWSNLSNPREVARAFLATVKSVS